MVLSDRVNRARTVEKRWSWPETLGFDESQKMGVSVEGLTKGMLPVRFLTLLAPLVNHANSLSFPGVL